MGSKNHLKRGFDFPRLHAKSISNIAWWRHQMEPFSALLTLCAGNSPVTGEFPSQRPVTRNFDVFFHLCLINGWVINRKTGDLRRHRAHYDVIVMDTVAPTFSGGLIARAMHDKSGLLVDFFIDNKGYFHGDIG